jgi:radical SAM superfamily enzyme YgiQ (UPF0313 family)
MPNGALTSLGGNIDPHPRIAVADLILVQRSVRTTLETLVKEIQPDLVGLSVMTFQRKTAKKIIELLRAIESDTGYERILGLSFRQSGHFQHNLDRPVSGLESAAIKLPNRGARILSGYTMLGRRVDVVETSRGCTFDCSFCSIIAMRGRNFYTYSFDRVLADLRDARDHGAQSIILVDDNITLNVRRFEALCQAIIDARLNRLEYIVQAMTSAIANHSVPLMRRAGFRYVFLGIENVLEADLKFLRAAAKNAQRESGRAIGNTLAEWLGRSASRLD